MKSKVPYRKALDEIDWSKVINLAEQHMDDVFNSEEGEMAKEDDDHYIFEAVLEAMYGKGVWKKYNEALK